MSWRNWATSALFTLSACGQGNYEVQVYGSDTVPVPGKSRTDSPPIVDKKLGRWYWAFNPTFDRSFRGESKTKGFEFSPNFKAGCDVTKVVSAGLEYYGSLGPVTGFDPLRDQQQQILPAIDLNLGPQWEFNLGVGIGMTRSTDHLLVKMILGRRF